MIADMEFDEKLKPIVTGLFLRRGKLDILFLLISQSYFIVPKNIRQNTSHCFIMRIRNKRKLQQIALSHSSDIEFKDFMKLYKNYT